MPTNRKAEDWSGLAERLVNAGEGALFKLLEDTATWLEKYQKKAGPYRGPQISDAEYKALLDKQGGVCAICRERPKGKLAVDHAHSTGKVRGLLCNFCNVGLGLFRDDERRLLAAVEYLKAIRV